MILIPPDGVTYKDGPAIGKINYVKNGIKKLHKFPENHKRLPRKLKKVIKYTCYFPMIEYKGKPGGVFLQRGSSKFLEWLEEKMIEANG